jgi:hypothetical protein
MTIMGESFRYRGFDVQLEVWESRKDHRIRWLCGATFVKNGLGYAASFSDRLFDWPGEARRYAEARAKQSLDSYAAGDTDVLGTPVSGHDSYQPQSPLGPFSDSRGRF